MHARSERRNNRVVRSVYGHVIHISFWMQKIPSGNKKKEFLPYNRKGAGCWYLCKSETDSPCKVRAIKKAGAQKKRPPAAFPE